MTDDTTTTQLATDDVASQTVDATFDLTQDGEDSDDSEVERPWLRPGKWYVVHSQSGYEKKVDANLKARIASYNLADRIYEIVIPMEDVVEFKQGRKQTVQKKVFPGYLLVRCEMDDETWFCIRNTPGVTGFVGQSQKGKLLRRCHAKKLKRSCRQKVTAKKPRSARHQNLTTKLVRAFALKRAHSQTSQVKLQKSMQTT